MTKIQPGRPLKRLTGALSRHFPIVVELHPQHLNIRLKGQRQGYDLTYEALLWQAYRQAAAARTRLRLIGRKLRRVC